MTFSLNYLFPAHYGYPRIVYHNCNNIHTCCLFILPPDLVASVASSRSWASSADLTWAKSRASVTVVNKDFLPFFDSSFSCLAETLNLEFLLGLRLENLCTSCELEEKLVWGGVRGRVPSPIVSSLIYGLCTDCFVLRTASSVYMFVWGGASCWVLSHNYGHLGMGLVPFKKTWWLIGLLCGTLVDSQNVRTE